MYCSCEPQHVGQKILGYLKERGITQTFVADRAGITLSKLNLALNGNRRLGLEEYTAVMGVLNLPLGTFLEIRPLSKD